MPLTTVTIRAEWEDDASVWVISCEEVPGLALEADSDDDILRKAIPAVEDLADFDADVRALPGRPLDVATLRHARLPAVA